MTPALAIDTIKWAEFALWLTVGLLFWRKQYAVRFPATSKYLSLKIASSPVLFLLTLRESVVAEPFRPAVTALHAGLFWAVNLTGAILLFFICVEIFRSALATYPALMKFGVLIVRWVAAVSIILSLALAPFAHRKLALLADLTTSFIWAVSVVALCLLAFLCLCMNALRLSKRDLSFGLAIGFGLIAVGDLTKVVLLNRPGLSYATAEIARGALILAALAVWTLYCALPEQERKPALAAAQSTVARWNEIANALGHSSAHVELQPRHSDGFFLSDVECVVDKVLNRNLKNTKQES